MKFTVLYTKDGATQSFAYDKMPTYTVAEV